MIRFFHLSALSIKTKLTKQWKRFDGKIVYQFMHLVIVFDMTAFVIVSGRVVLGFCLSF